MPGESQPGASVLLRHYKEVPLCNGALYQEYNPQDDYLDTILTEPGEPEPKEKFRAKQLLFTGSRSTVSGLVPVQQKMLLLSQTAKYFAGIDGWCVPEISQGCCGSNCPYF